MLICNLHPVAHSCILQPLKMHDSSQALASSHIQGSNTISCDCFNFLFVAGPLTERERWVENLEGMSQRLLLSGS